MCVSIALPTFNRSLLLPQTIPALAHRQSAPDLDYDVIFVSRSSSDGNTLVEQLGAQI